MREQKKRTSRLKIVMVLTIYAILAMLGWSLGARLAHSDELPEPPKPKPQQFVFAIGTYYDANNNLDITLGDYNLFDQAEPYFGLRRYGGGGGHYMVGNKAEGKFEPNLGFHAQGNNGTVIIGLDPNERNAVFPMIGAEVLNGRVNLNTTKTSNMQDYYEGFFGPSVGVQADIYGCRIMPLVRAGGAAGTLGKNGLVPDVNFAYGPGAHISCHGLEVSYGHLYLWDRHKDKQMEDAAVMLRVSERNQLGFQYEDTHGIFKEESYSLFLKRAW